MMTHVHQHTSSSFALISTKIDGGLGDSERNTGAIAQLGEHLPCTQGVSGSIPLSSTNSITFRFQGELTRSEGSDNKLAEEKLTAQ